MAGTTAWVRKALQELGPDAPDVAVKVYIREKAPGVPESQIGLALGKLRGKVVPALTRAAHRKQKTPNAKLRASPRVRAMGLQVRDPVGTKEPAVEKLQATADAEQRVAKQGRGERHDRRPAALRRVVGQDEFNVAEQQGVQLAPSANAVARVGPEPNAQLPTYIERKHRVVRTGVEDRAGEVADQSARAEDIHGNERAPADGSPRGERGGRRPGERFVLLGEGQH